MSVRADPAKVERGAGEIRRQQERRLSRGGYP